MPARAQDVAAADVLFLAVPAAAVRSTLRRIAPVLRGNQILVHSVGSLLPAESGQLAKLVSQVILEETPPTRVGALAGPALAKIWKSGVRPPWSVAAPSRASLPRSARCCRARRCASTPVAIWWASELARAMSGVVALASGVCEVLEFGPAARAVLVSRSAAEFARLGSALGGRERTFAGLAAGGLMVASQRRDAADYQLGSQLGSGHRARDALKEVARTCESVNMIREAHRLADSHACACRSCPRCTAGSAARSS